MVGARNVTVAIPSIPGREQLLARALESVAAQTTAPRRILVHTDTERHGAAWTRNRLLRQVRTGWVAWLDDDDELLPNHLEVLIRGANNSGGCEDSLALLKLLDAGARFHHVLGVRTWRYHVWGGNVGGRGITP
jgi:glycosyltransferase involved in cell wall biosynthesis